MKIISVSVNAVNIDDNSRWCTYNLMTGDKKIVPKTAWPTYAISLTAYRNFYPIDPPIDIDSPDDIDEGLIEEIQHRARPFRVYNKPA